MPVAGQRVIFVLGIRARSGTNYLGTLISRHPDCAPAQGLWEDGLIRELERLERYIDAASRHWGKRHRKQRAADLRRGLGRGIQGMLTERETAPFVWVKTPSVGGLHLARSFFPDAAVLLLVRDGRAVAESARRTFGRGATLETEAKAWAEGARSILDFLAVDTGPHALVRYEDLVSAPEVELRRVFVDLGLDPTRYDFSGLGLVPVKGSSTYFGAASRPHWIGIPKDKTFQPLARTASWAEGRHRRFDAVAGGELEELGYERQGFRRTPTTVMADGLITALGRLVRWACALKIRARRLSKEVRRNYT